MILIRELKKADKKTLQAIAALHTRAFPGFFLTRLGPGFLRTLYNGYMEDKDSGIIVAEEKEEIIGFIAFSKDYPRFFKSLIKHHLMAFGFCSIGAAIRHPSFVRRLFGAFKKSDSVVKNERYVELASICVDPSAEKRGIGTSLIDYLKGIVDFSTYAYINLETDTDNNDSANRFYQKNGFKLSRQYTTGEGRRMNEYRYTPENCR